MNLAEIPMKPIGDVTADELAGGVLLWSGSTAVPTVWVDSAAAAIWQCLDGQVTANELAVDVAHVIDSEPAAVLPGIMQTIEGLADAGFLFDPSVGPDPSGQTSDNDDLDGATVTGSCSEDASLTSVVIGGRIVTPAYSIAPDT